MTKLRLEVPPSRTRRLLVIEPARRWEIVNLREIWGFRDLFYLLMLRDVKLRYKQTALGIVWVVLQPLVAALIFAVIFGRFAGLPSGNVPYLPFVFAGLLAWNLFAGALGRAGNSLLSDSRLISKVYFPRIIIPMASSAAVLVDFAVSLVVMLGLLVAFQIPFTWNLLTLPFWLGLALLNAVGVSLFFSALNVYYRDFSYALPFVIQVWMYASPVVYSADLIPGPLKSVYAINPIVGVIDGFRWALLGAGEFPLLTAAISLALGIALLIAGGLVFSRVENSFADVI